MYSFWEDVVVPVVIIGFFVLFLGFPLLYGIADSLASRRCLKAGWPSAKITWSFDTYCIARTDQTDIVKPLKWAEANPR